MFIANSTVHLPESSEVIPSWIQSLTDLDAKRIADDLAPVLRAATERVHYAEARRAQYIVVAGGLFGGAIALASVANEPILQSLTWSIEAAAIGFFALSLILFYIYSKQVNRYPWTSATETWKWFYRNAIPEQEKFDHKFYNWLFRWKKEVKQARNEFSRQLPIFGNSIANIAVQKESLWQDIQQLYVLHINEKYKNKYLSWLRTTLTSGLVFILVITALLAIVQPQMHHRKLVQKIFGGQASHIEMFAAKVRTVSCEDDCWLANINAVNNSNMPNFVRIITTKSRCLITPIDEDNWFIVEPHGMTMRAIYFICPGSSPEKISVSVQADDG